MTQLTVILLLAYAIILTAIGIFDNSHTRGFSDYVVAGRRQKSLMVTFSMLATAIGASATMGITGLAYKTGFPAFWWLGVGAIGLVLQSFLLSAKVRQYEAYTLPDLAEKTLGRPVRPVVALIIVISWIGIIAAQFVAAGHLISSMTGLAFERLILVSSAVMILYTLLGGQTSILKTDFLQFAVLGGAVLMTVIFLYAGTPPKGLEFNLLNESFGAFDLTYFALIVGGSYFIGPDMFTRLFTAKDPQTARRAALGSGILLLVFGVLITLVGMWAASQAPGITSDVLSHVIANHLPGWLGLVLGFGLLSAIVSSADTCMITTASIVAHDLCGRKNTKTVRLFVATIGGLSLALAVFSGDIIALLISAYAVYSSGIVPVMFAAIVSERRLNQIWALTGIIGGGLLGLASNWTANKPLALAGLALSSVCALIAWLRAQPQS